jgi:hypothetical protein
LIDWFIGWLIDWLIGTSTKPPSRAKFTLDFSHVFSRWNILDIFPCCSVWLSHPLFSPGQFQKYATKK